MDILLTDKAFLGIVVSALEVYKNECLGVLLGFNLQNRIVVEYAIPYQTARRKYTEVEPHWERSDRIRQLLPELSYLRHLGFFHSHTQRGEDRAIPVLGGLDKKSMYPTDIEIIVAVNDAKKQIPWKQGPKDLMGTLGDYYLRMAAHYLRKKDSKFLHYRLVCPYVMGFEKSTLDQIEL